MLPEQSGDHVIMDQEDYLTILKILMIGESNVGKSRYKCLRHRRSSTPRYVRLIIHYVVYSILLRFTEDEFYENMQSTVGMDYKTKQISIDGNLVKLAIWVCVIALFMEKKSGAVLSM